MTHICVGNLIIIGSDIGLSPGRRQAIIWTNAGILLIGTLGTNFSEILIEIQTFSFKKLRLKMSSAKWRPFYLGLGRSSFEDRWSPTFDIYDILLTYPCVVMIRISVLSSFDLKKSPFIHTRVSATQASICDIASYLDVSSDGLNAI